MHVNNSTIQERLWVNGDADLETILAIVRKSKLCRSVKQVKGDTNAVADKPETNIAKIDRKRINKNDEFGWKKHPSGSKSKTPSDNKDNLRCYRCNSRSHLVNYKYCPAIKQKCSNCGIMGHFTKCCNKKKNNRVNCIEQNSSEDDESDSVSFVLHIKGPEGTILNIDNHVVKKKPLCNMVIGGIEIQMYADSGSPYSIINEKVWKSKFAERLGEKLDSSDIDPEGYSGEKIEILGYRTLIFRFKNRECTARLYVAKRGPSVLSWCEQGKLDIIFNPNSPEPVMVIDQHNCTDNHIVKKFPEVFKTQIGKLVNFKHMIRLKENACPKVFKARNIPIAVRDEVKKELDSLVSEGIIERIESSEWVSPIVVARRANGKISLCIDLRYLNKNIIVAHFPLPRIPEMLASVVGGGGSKMFSTIDLSAAYHHIELHENSKDLTAFITPFGCCRFNRLPFGLASAAAIFQRVMQDLLCKCKNAICFQDDVLLFGNTELEHSAALETVLKVLSHNGLTKHSKCKFHMKSVTYLGHELCEEGIKPKTSLVEAIQAAPHPTCRDDVRSFLGLAEFYAKCVPNFSGRMFNIRQLVKNKNKFIWSNECEKEFQDVKKAICNAIALSTFDPTLTCIITTDASF